MTTQEGRAALATDDEIAELRAGLDRVTPGPWKAEGYIVMGDWQASGAIASIKTGARAFSDTKHLARCSPDRMARYLDRLEAAERQVKELRKELTFVGDMAVYALKTDDDDTSGILATISGHVPRRPGGQEP